MEEKELRRIFCNLVIEYTEQEYIPLPDTSIINDMIDLIKKAKQEVSAEKDKEIASMQEEINRLSDELIDKADLIDLKSK